MKLLKSLLLGSAALLLAGGAQAADLPGKGKAAPVEYVKVCSTYGAGFFFVPGTEGCLRVSGQVRAELQYRETAARATNNTEFRARARIFLDHRNQTEYGLLRTYIFYQLNKDSGAATSAFLYYGFVQFAGFTAGRYGSFHDFYANNLVWTQLAVSERPINGFGYTASFGGGFTATLALEDATERRTGAFYAGQALPDIVLALRAEQPWGAAQLSGALRQLRHTTATVDTEYGFAVRAGVQVKLDMIAKGDVLWLEGVYADGGLDYVLGNGGAATWGGGNPGFGFTGTGNAGAVAIADAALVGANLKTSKAWGIVAAFRHNWTPTWRSVLNVTYADVNQPVGSADFRDLRVGKQLVWSPVAGLDIGVEAVYARLTVKGAAADDQAWSGRLRVQRTF